jgi:hypothetical protein
MYFEKFMNGGVAAMEPVSHIDILLSAQEAIEETYEAEMALMEEEGGAYIQAAQFGSEGIGDAAAAIGEKAKELGSAILKKIEEFIRKVKAFLSNFINSMRQGAIVSTLKSAISKAEKRLKATDSDWAQNSPDPKKVTAWNSDVTSTLNRTLFVTSEAVNDLVEGTKKSLAKAKKAWGDKNAPMNYEYDTTAKDGHIRVPSGSGASTSAASFLDSDLLGVADAMSHSSSSAVKSAGTAPGSASASARVTKWLGPLSGFDKFFRVTDRKTNMQIAKDAAAAAGQIINSMQKDPVLQAYRAVQELEREIGAARGLANDAGKDGSKQAKALKKLQGIVHKSGTTATLMARKQLGSWKTIAALNVRMFSMAGSKERDDYKED